MQIQRVGVVGAGTMGNGIAHVFARSGYAVTLFDVEQRFLDRALDTIAKNIARETAKAKITAEQEAAALEHGAQVWLIPQKCFGETMAHGPGLTGQATAGYGAYNVVLTLTI